MARREQHTVLPVTLRQVECDHDWVTTREAVRLVAEYALPIRVERCAKCRIRRIIHWELDVSPGETTPIPREITEWV